jgi:uncharacterized protein YkwD
MNRRKVSLLISACLAGVLLSACVPADHKSPGKQEESPIRKEAFEEFQKKLLECHNKERESRGYKPLDMDRELCGYAQRHAEYMAENDRLVHSPISKIMKIADSSSAGENIAWGQKDEESVVNSWMWSPGHRWNILGSSYKRVGFGMKEDSNGRKYWCVVFSN